MTIKTVIKRVPLLNQVAFFIIKKVKQYKCLRNNKLQITRGGVKKDIIGSNNRICVKEGCRINKLILRVRGDSNTLIIEEDCYFGSNCSIWIEGNNISINIGKGSTFTTRCHINAQEAGSKITIGEDCMFSNHIIVRTSDSHPIFDLVSGERLNKPDSVTIGNHVWVAPNVKIMKGSVIPDGCIIGSDTTTSKAFYEKNVLIVGRPAHIIKKNINWTRDKLF